ncbi:hypothetical protein ACQPYA_07895 [Micromonospora sp. CA-263727]|uniref:hypothetical protein n=1 Tax=Micromonospora sp. CA-263727 TaxID=3239967 RepID=UPI003D8D37A8
MNAPRWIIHLPTTLTSLGEVTALTIALRDSLGHITAIDFGETTLSEENKQFVRTRIWCDAPHDGPNRCRLPNNHPNPCTTTDGTADR